MRILIAIVVLFPWSFVLIGAVSYVRHRLGRRVPPTPPARLRPDAELPPSQPLPVLLDSAQICKALRDTRQ